MKQRGIIMRDWEVRAIREGRKTQKRFIIRPQPRVIHAIYNDASIETNLLFRRKDQRIHCPYGKPGDLLKVKETWGMSFEDIVPSGRQFVSGGTWGSPANPNRKPCVVFKADGDMPDDSPGETATWCSPILMPHWASRITLEIVSVRAQRLQDITEEDAKAEGVEERWPWKHPVPFGILWESIHGPGSWERNDFVFAVEFKDVKP